MTKLLTAQEVADLLSIKKRTVYQLKATEKIPYIKIGGVIRFDKDQIENWIKSKGDADGHN